MAKGRSKVLAIEGVGQTLRNLRELPRAVQNQVLRPAVTRAAQPVLKEARVLAPVGDGLTPDGRQRPHLAKTLRKTRAKVYRKTGTVLVVLGPEKNKAPHSHLVHDGTKSHTIVLGKAAVLKNVILPAGTKIEHPGAKENPFMDDAAAATKGQSKAILEDMIGKGIEKQAAKLARKKAGG